MKQILTFFVAILAGGPAHGLSFDEARHLLSRTGFGVASPSEIESFLPLNYETAVERILNGVRKATTVAIPKFQAHPRERRRVRKLDADGRRDFQRRVRQDRLALKRWWIEEMLQTDSPFTERLVLFWHNHFVSEAKKVKFGQMVYQQNAAFRHFALGNFADLLRDISTGPAMLWYLDGQKNRKGKPNENFAREVLELFTLGEGQGYTEFDIREAARAFTGWTVVPTTGKFRFNFGVHDNLIKTFLGHDGNFDGLDILEIVLKQPRVAAFITEKLWREFISPTPDAQAVRRLASIFRRSEYEIRPLMKALLMTPQFRDPGNRGILIKSPAELIVGTLRLLKFSNVDSEILLKRHRQLGQDLLDPPDVKGWRGGTAWITSTTTLRREQFLRGVFRSVQAAGRPLDKMTMAMKMRPFGDADPRSLLAAERRQPGMMRNILLATEPIMAASRRGKHKRLLRNLLLDPVYQLK